MGTRAIEDIHIGLVHYPVLSLGAGRRVGIWFQGCNIRCKGCISQYTWEVNDTCKTTVGRLLADIAGYKCAAPDGITISGGEPFDQPAALYSLLSGIREHGFNDIMVYSGYEYDYLKENYPDILALIDVLIDGCFVEGLTTSYSWKGSENQRMIVLAKDDALIQRYREYGQNADRRLQIIEKTGSVYIVGIPLQSDSEEIKNVLG
ncbi:MAG: radical SAM protein [Nitrospirae bacterium]|nr:MAG: radical SAM protein [Nitrospirota bacterium]